MAEELLMIKVNIFFFLMIYSHIYCVLGPVLAWLHAIEAYRELKQDIPINLKFVFEGMEESGSDNLDIELEKRKDTFLKVLTRLIF